jgi:hypothetical protein
MAQSTPATLVALVVTFRSEIDVVVEFYSRYLKMRSDQRQCESGLDISQ